MKKIIILLFLPAYLWAQPFTKPELSRWEQQAKHVNIIRDNWGIPHIYGNTDADAVFGLMYAQCEDDFKRVELNYIEKLGRLAEIKGESQLYNDLYLKLIIDSADAIADYKKSPAWMRKLLSAFADGINYYLHKHPSSKPALLHRFQPWYPLLWTDGSIGAISTGDITEADVKNLYSGNSAAVAALPYRSRENLSGSNGFALGPSKTASGNAILYINPHVTFYFRPEVHMVSNQGLNAYGAVTWGQFFVYQGFNEYCGWMHTSGNADVSDMYKETMQEKNHRTFYSYDGKWRPVANKRIIIRIKKEHSIETKEFIAKYTGHGPVMAKRNGTYLSVKSYNRSLTSLIQSWERTKATGFESYKKNMELSGNTSNNTVFADNKGNIAYWHGNFIPKRNPRLNWGKAVDGSTSATEWHGLHALNEIVHVYNPTTGWIQNCNSTPFTVSGTSSPKKEDYPAYMAPDGENFRGINAARLLSRQDAFTIDQTIATGYDNYLAAFEVLVPALLRACQSTAGTADALLSRLAGPIGILKSWDYRSDENSVATTLAVGWAERLTDDIRKVYIEEGEDDQVTMTTKFAQAASSKELLEPLLATVQDLQSRFGRWEIPWGELNRFQRISGDIDQRYDDKKPSIPVGYASSLWGMLPSYASSYYEGTNKRYGVKGNSFICAVEFGKRLTAKSLLAGGESSDPSSKHFNDQLGMYAKGVFKDVLFYKEDVLKHAEIQYHPGER